MKSVLLKAKDCYKLWMTLQRNFPTIERYGLGEKINDIFLETLEYIFVSIYLPPEEKILTLGKTITRLDSLKFFTQMAWENKLIQTIKYAEIVERYEEIGRMLGGWRKGLQNKTPTNNVGE